MSAMRIFCVAIFALLLASCTKQGYRNFDCGMAQAAFWLTFGVVDYEQEFCDPEPAETTAANGSQANPKQTPSPIPSPTASAAPASPVSQTTPDPNQSLAKNPCDCNGATYCERFVSTGPTGNSTAGLGPPPDSSSSVAGLGPPPQEQAATLTAGLGPPPNSPAAPAPASPSSPGTTAMPTPPVVPVPVNPPAPQPPTARYNPGNVCNPTPPPPPKPGNICNPTPPALSKPGNICNPSTPSKAGNAGQQTAAVPPQNPLSPSTGRMNSGECHTVNGQMTCTDASGNSCTTTGGFCDPTAPQPTKTAAAPAPPKPNEGPLNLKPPAQMASAGNPCNQKNQSTPVQACESKPPYLPWGGRGSATITVSGGKPCGIGWHDTGATILDSMSVSSPPAHGSLRPQDQHVIIFTPTPGYKGQDSFILSMREHNGGRSATLSVTVSLTIQ